MKVRGTAQTVADKYLQLARDAHSAGDTVMAEGYFQHAEHYLRIVAASQPVAQQNTPQRRDDYSYDDDDDDDQPTPASGNGESQRQQQQQQYQPQPQPQQQAQQPSARAANDSEGNEQVTGHNGSQNGQNGGQDGEQPWGGPEPEFLRRGPANGTPRARRTRQPRSNGRKDASSTRNDDAGNDANDTGASDTGGHDTTEQA